MQHVFSPRNISRKLQFKCYHNLMFLLKYSGSTYCVGTKTLYALQYYVSSQTKASFIHIFARSSFHSWLWVSTKPFSLHLFHFFISFHVIPLFSTSTFIQLPSPRPSSLSLSYQFQLIHSPWHSHLLPWTYTPILPSHVYRRIPHKSWIYFTYS